jgi:hypothetical protein
MRTKNRRKLWPSRNAAQVVCPLSGCGNPSVAGRLTLSCLSCLTASRICPASLCRIVTTHGPKKALCRRPPSLIRRGRRTDMANALVPCFSSVIGLPSGWFRRRGESGFPLSLRRYGGCSYSLRSQRPHVVSTFLMRRRPARRLEKRSDLQLWRLHEKNACDFGSCALLRFVHGDGANGGRE